MKKIVVCFVIAILILIVGVFADTKDVREEIKDFIEEKGIVVEDRDIMQVNFSDLSDEVKVNIEKIGNTSIVIFKVNSSKPFFVVTSSSESFQAEPLVNVCDTKLLLYFGINEVNGESDFLNMASGVQSSLKKGYVMIRDGSITGISTNLEITEFSYNEKVEIIIYKNGEKVGFRNFLKVDSSGVKIDYDTQSKGIVNFKAGDVISVYLNLGKEISLTDVTTTIEVTN